MGLNNANHKHILHDKIANNKILNLKLETKL